MPGLSQALHNWPKSVFNPRRSSSSKSTRSKGTDSTDIITMAQKATYTYLGKTGLRVSVPVVSLVSRHNPTMHDAHSAAMMQDWGNVVRQSCMGGMLYSPLRVGIA